jgi:hypothetical protein
MPKICNKRLQVKLSLNQTLKTTDSAPKLLIQSLSPSKTSSTKAAATKTDPTTVASNVTGKIEIEHSFVYKRVYDRDAQQLVCVACNEKIKAKTYKNCQDCNIVVHEKCSQQAEKNCYKKSTDDETADEDLHASPDQDDGDNDENINNKTRSISDIDEETGSQICAELAGKVYYNADKKQDVNKAKTRKKNQIVLQRVSQRVKKHADFFWRGHMIYATNNDPKVFFSQVGTLQFQPQSIEIFNFARPLRTIGSWMLKRSTSTTTTSSKTSYLKYL